MSFISEPGPPRVEWIEGKEHSSPEIDGCLFAFTQLASKPTDARLADFSMRWGPLGICQHGWLSTHSNCSCEPLSSPGRYWEGRSEQIAWHSDYWTEPGDIPFSELRGKYWEPLVAWRFYVRKFAAVLNIAYWLRKGKSGRWEDWARVASVQDGMNMEGEFALREWQLTSFNIEQGHELAMLAHGEQRACLANVVTQWMIDAAVIPWVSWVADDRAQLGLTLGGPMVAPGDPFSKYEWHRATLYGLLATQLAAAIARPGEFALCDWCEQAYKPDRKPQANRNHYCSPACKKEAHRAGDAKYQRKKRCQLKEARTPTDTPTDMNGGERL